MHASLMLWLSHRSDAETGGGGGRLRQRRNVQQVGPSPSDMRVHQVEEDSEKGDAERDQHNRAYRGTLDNAFSYLLLPYVQYMYMFHFMNLTTYSKLNM